MKQRLSAISIAAISAASLLMVSTAGIAAQKSHAMHENYKAEANFKAEVPPPCPPILVLHDGFYLGIGVGYDSYRVRQTLDETIFDIPTGAAVFSDSFSQASSATGWMGGIFAGYGRYFDTFYLGLEINANASNADATASNSDSFGDSSYIKLKARTSYGIALLPGLKVNDSTLLYVRLGYLRTNFRASFSETEVDFFTGGLDTESASSNKWRNGFQYGIGMETAVAEDISIRGEYTHTSFSSKTISGTVTDPIFAEAINTSAKFSLSNNEFMLSAIYHFA